MKWFWTFCSVILFGTITAAVLFIFLMSQLPDVETLKDVKMQVPLRIYTRDHRLIAEYGEKRRIPVTFEQVPSDLIQAILTTEDQRFYEHPGVDIYGLMRAAIQLIKTGTKSQGGSTITMQVARNFFLSSKKTYLRKFNEILLAIKIDRELSKQKILELYLNKIYFGNRAYGVAAAAYVYYGKPLADLTLAQMAMIAGLPKAPSSINPLANPRAAIERRNHVLERMYEVNDIDKSAFDAAVAAPVTATYHGTKIEVNAPYVAEMIRQALYTHYGKAAYTHGYNVITTIDSRLQQMANNSLHQGLLAYDRRHGFRGPLENLGTPSETTLLTWLKQLKAIPTVNDLQPAAIIELQGQTATALLASGDTITLPWRGLVWARLALPNGQRGSAPQTADDILDLGDVVYVSKHQPWRLAQLPQIEGALINLDPNSGAINALVGGFAYHQSNFNRAIQATRQPGSAFKPFIYSAALAKGYTLASIINDAPLVLNDPSQEHLWRPQNDNRTFNGPTRLRIGLIRSRNLVSIRLLEQIGIPYAIGFLKQFGFSETDLPRTLSLALGSVSVTPLQLAAAYAVIANGGFRVEPHVIREITNASGDIILRADLKLACRSCDSDQAHQLPHIAESKRAPRVISPQVSYLMTLALRDVIQHGTGRRAKVLKRHDLAGKTGTTNDKVDAWFSGFNADSVTTVWVGFDQPRSIYEYGAQAALPIWINFMRHALKSHRETPLPQPSGIVTVRIDKKTGLLAPPNDKNSVFEYFRQQYAPKEYTPQENFDETQVLGEG